MSDGDEVSSWVQRAQEAALEREREWEKNTNYDEIINLTGHPLSFVFSYGKSKSYDGVGFTIPSSGHAKLEHKEIKNDLEIRLPFEISSGHEIPTSRMETDVVNVPPLAPNHRILYVVDIEVFEHLRHYRSDIATPTSVISGVGLEGRGTFGLVMV